MNRPIPTQIYHFTHITNVRGILEATGLLCNNDCDVERVSIAHDHIQSRRRRIRVPCGPGGNLHNYVPFYFCFRSPMLYAIHGGWVEGYSGGQDELVYLVSSVQKVQEAGLDFVFTDRSAVYDYATFYMAPANLNQIDWDLMPSRWWNNIREYPDRKERKQAEFLVHGFFPWSLVEYLAVKTPRMKRRVETLLAEHPASMQRPVRVEPRWYY